MNLACDITCLAFHSLNRWSCDLLVPHPPIIF